MPFGLAIPDLLTNLVILLLAIPIHEWAHAWSAHQLGDDTASLQGRLTLNPLAHLDPVGSILILMGGLGWGKPVPVNPLRMRTNPRVGMALSAAAGPFSNFVLAMLLAIPFRLGLLNPYGGTGALSIETFLLTAMSVNVGLMLFNLLPLYPLDGEKVLVGILPPRLGDGLLRLRPFEPLVLAGLLFVLPLVGFDLIWTIIGPVNSFLYRLLLFTR